MQLLRTTLQTHRDQQDQKLSDRCDQALMLSTKLQQFPPYCYVIFEQVPQLVEQSMHQKSQVMKLHSTTQKYLSPFQTTRKEISRQVPMTMKTEEVLG